MTLTLNYKTAETWFLKLSHGIAMPYSEPLFLICRQQQRVVAVDLSKSCLGKCREQNITDAYVYERFALPVSPSLLRGKVGPRLLRRASMLASALKALGKISLEKTSEGAGTGCTPRSR